MIKNRIWYNLLYDAGSIAKTYSIDHTEPSEALVGSAQLLIGSSEDEQLSLVISILLPDGQLSIVFIPMGEAVPLLRRILVEAMQAQDSYHAQQN